MELVQQVFFCQCSLFILLYNKLDKLEIKIEYCVLYYQSIAHGEAGHLGQPVALHVALGPKTGYVPYLHMKQMEELLAVGIALKLRSFLVEHAHLVINIKFSIYEARPYKANFYQL